jgi:hypothetical protein
VALVEERVGSIQMGSKNERGSRFACWTDCFDRVRIGLVSSAWLCPGRSARVADCGAVESVFNVCARDDKRYQIVNIPLVYVLDGGVK